MGVAQKDKLGVNAYPTMVFIDPASEEVIHKIVGYNNAQSLLKSTTSGLSGRNLKTMNARYDAANAAMNLSKNMLKYSPMPTKKIVWPKS